MKSARWLLISLSVLILGGTQQKTYVAHNLTEFPGPQVYKDPTSGTLIYVESDGRHVAAISVDGKLLWNREPHADAHLEFYRTEKPQIVYVGPALKSQLRKGERVERFVGIRFNNSQFGVIRIGDGQFIFGGKD